MNCSIRVLENADFANKEHLAIILGNEGYGLSDEVISQCDMCIEIPMANDVDSLNVAAASAVAFWECGRIIR